MAYGSFREMPVWQKAMNVAETLHSLTDTLPKKEDYGFTSQVRRAALSISANIAEAYGRKHLLEPQLLLPRTWFADRNTKSS